MNDYTAPLQEVSADFCLRGKHSWVSQTDFGEPLCLAAVTSWSENGSAITNGLPVEVCADCGIIRAISPNADPKLKAKARLADRLADLERKMEALEKQSGGPMMKCDCCETMNPWRPNEPGEDNPRAVDADGRIPTRPQRE